MLHHESFVPNVFERLLLGGSRLHAKADIHPVKGVHQIDRDREGASFKLDGSTKGLN